MSTGRFLHGRAIEYDDSGVFISMILGNYEANLDPRNPFKALLCEYNCCTSYSAQNIVRVQRYITMYGETNQQASWRSRGFDLLSEHSD